MQQELQNTNIGVLIQKYVCVINGSGNQIHNFFIIPFALFFYLKYLFNCFLRKKYCP